MTTIVTGLWGGHVQRFAGSFTKGLAQYAPEIPVCVFIDGPYVPPGRYAQLFTMGQTNGWSQFMARHENHAAAHGRSPTPKWKRGAIESGYYFKFDAVRFAGQAFVPEAMADALSDGELLVWLDGDVQAFAPIPKGFFDELVGDEDGAYLGRGGKHSEIGYWCVRLSPRSRLFLHRFAELYRSDELFELKEWHSAFVWDHARREAEAVGGFKMRNLTPHGHDHVWFQSPLGKYLDHLKGEKRKRRGSSPERRGGT